MRAFSLFGMPEVIGPPGTKKLASSTSTDDRSRRTARALEDAGVARITLNRPDARNGGTAMMAWLTHCSPSMAMVRRWVRWGAGPRAVQYLVLGAKARAVLQGERVALNFVQRMCGIATATSRYVEAVDGTAGGSATTGPSVGGVGRFRRRLNDSETDLNYANTNIYTGT